MLNTKKLLYILPDVAYSAELLPSKKPATYSVSSFRQINGEFMDDNEFLAENILKLFHKIDPEEYQLILPDFLFTNTIVNIREKSDAKIKEHLTKKLLPELGLGTDTHQIDTTVLNEHNGSTRVQLSALEKSLLEPLQISAQQTQVKIKSISPLSWSIKSIVSLEPSISVIQIDSMLYIALHYIGVDQANQATVENVDNIYETIKTLKGSEPSIQTIYLLSNELIEEQLKEHLSNTLPIQQLAGKQDEASKMPSYVKKIIESSMRTLSINDYPVPQFKIGKAPAGAKIELTPETEEIKPDKTQNNSDEQTSAAELALPKPQKDIKNDPKEKGIDMKKTTTTPVVTTTEDLVVKNENNEDDEIEALLEGLKENQGEAKAPSDKSNDSSKNKKNHPSKPVPSKNKKVIRNKDKTKNMLRMVFVTLAVFFATVGIGIGIGLGVLRITQPSSTEPASPVVEITASPTPSPSPSPSPEPEIKTADLSVLVVNATTKAGYAGKVADLLTDFKTVKAGNAKGDYDPGTYVLMTDKNQALISLLEKTTDLQYTFQEKNGTEDPQEKYDAVIVLAK